MRTRMLLVVLVLVISACGSSGDTAAGGGSSSTSSSVPPSSGPDSSTPGSSTTSVPDGGTGTGGDGEGNGDGGDGEEARTDWMTFAAGALPVGASGVENAATEQVQAIDGNTVGRAYYTGMVADALVEFTYRLPAATTFDRFAVPNILETPSAGATFFKQVVVSGSATGPTDGFAELARAELATHSGRNQVTELEITGTAEVRWVRISLSGGILVEEPSNPNMTLEFSEIVGNGTQRTQDFAADTFTGIWEVRLADLPGRRGDAIELMQTGATVTGCVGRTDINGTVNGQILRATGINRDTGNRSVFIILPASDGTLLGVISDNGGPFALNPMPLAPEGTTTDCSEIPLAPPVCGAVVYVNFDVNSADIRPDSDQILADLFGRLSASDEASITIVGYTSSEGSDEYNQGLSERRAASVVADLVRRGINSSRVGSQGRGESNPIASNDDEAGRSLNRRVEVECAE